MSHVWGGETSGKKVTSATGCWGKLNFPVKPSNFHSAISPFFLGKYAWLARRFKILAKSSLCNICESGRLMFDGSRTVYTTRINRKSLDFSTEDDSAAWIRRVRRASLTLVSASFATAAPSVWHWSRRSCWPGTTDCPLAASCRPLMSWGNRYRVFISISFSSARANVG